MTEEQSAVPLLYQSNNDHEKQWTSDFHNPDIAEDQLVLRGPLQRRYHVVISALVLSCMLNIFQFAISPTLLRNLSSNSSIVTLYSPARSILRPVLRKFSPAFGLEGSAAIYIQPPSTPTDDAWKALYYTTLSITHAEAEQLPNKTVPLSAAPDTGYLTGLNVFHDLHCLDSIRKALWVGALTDKHHTDTSTSHHSTTQDKSVDPEVLAAYRAEMHDPSHLMHCINGLRESIMCHSDVTPLSWQWSPADKGVRVYSDVVHSCHDFSAVLEWGRQHATSERLDRSGWTDGQPPEIGRCGLEDDHCG